jgi:tetratricopeptide (TPR) repeat protein
VSGERAYDLEPVRADGWFDRVIAGVPALERLCRSAGEALVALSLAAGFRIVSAAMDRVSGEVSQLSWVRDLPDGGEAPGSGDAGRLRSEVLAALLGEPDASEPLPEEPDATALRACLGPRYVLLAPLFGLTLRRLLCEPLSEPRVVVGHDGIEEIVPLRQLQRFLRARVVEVLQGERARGGVSIDLEQAEQAREALAQGHPEDAVARLAGWVGPLMTYHRTAEGAALEPRVRAQLARALGTLGAALLELKRAEEAEETLRLALQYAHDNDAAPELYRTLGRVLLTQGRGTEAIGPLRRARVLDPAAGETLVDLARCYLAAGRAVAAYCCLREGRAQGLDAAVLEPLEAEVRAILGEAATRFEAHLTHAQA